MGALLTAVAWVLLGWVGLLLRPFRWRPAGMVLFVPKMVAQGIAPLLAAASSAVAVVALAMRRRWAAVPALAAAAVGAGYVARVGWRPLVPVLDEPMVQHDVVVGTMPESGRELLADVWQPPVSVEPSGVAVVYLHSSAWMVFDKGAGTDTVFAQLTGQGHVVVDVAYRLYPEAQIPGMVADAKRAVAWVRAEAEELSIDPERVVLAGGSAGGHLALLAAYTASDRALAPAGIESTDVSVAAVVGLYAAADLTFMYHDTGQATACHPDDPQPDWDAPPPQWMVRMFGEDAEKSRMAVMPVAGRLDWLVGGTPAEVGEEYDRLSPLHRVHEGCPPTLLVHGEHDMMASVEAVRQLEVHLRRCGVPVTAVYLPDTDHAFDIVTPRWSAPARACTEAIVAFLAGVAGRS